MTQYDTDQQDTNINLIAPSSGWTPPSGQDVGLDTYRTLTQLELMTNLKKKPLYRCNLKKEELAAMKELTAEKSIIIKPADKGGCIVIMDRTDYINEGLRQLQNPQHYRRLQVDPTDGFTKDINNIITQAFHNDIIDSKTKKNLITKFPRIANFYMLPKIHKPNNPGRPIVNSIGTITEKISAYIDSTLRPLASKVTSYIKDTSAYLQMIKDMDITDEDILVTIDVSALYTNIPHDEGILAIRECMTENNIDTDKKNLICELATKVLKCNYFEFNDKLYIQNQGTAMGTRMAPNYAIIFMHKLETRLLQESALKPKIWKRFIDDVFCVWEHGMDTLLEFLNDLNSKHQTIKFTWEISRTHIPFLDTITYKLDNKLATKIYHKPTDNKKYLHYTSCHPKRQKDSVPNGLYLRARRICTKVIDFESEARQITRKLLNRSYPEQLLTDTLQKIRALNRDDLLKPRIRTKNEKIRYITNYNPNNPLPNNTIKKFSDILHTTRKPAITPEDLQVTFSRSTNIRDILVKGNLNSIHKPRSCTPCMKKCKTCDRVTTNLAITNSTKESFPIRGSFNCQSYNIIYLMTCDICNIQYIGESSNTMNTRCRGHESAIRTDQLHPVAKHYNKNNHTPTSYTITAIDQEANKNKRLRLEESWMILMNTLQPYGLNARL
jgi:hypothetical protein